MADVKIRVLGEDDASKVIKKVDDNLDNLGKTAGGNTKTGLKSLSSAIIPVATALAAAGIAAKQAYQVISEGAQLELAEIRFNRLATSIGTTGDALMKDLAPAVGGMMSNAETMGLAGDLMSLGLAKTSEEAIRLTGVASQLGMNMNQLVLTLTNKTTMRFDALGVAVDGFDAKVKTLEATGMSADEAFKWAFIEQAEGQIERVGSVAETTAGELMKLEAGLANLKDEAKKSAASLAGPVVSAINDSRDALALLNLSYDQGIISTGEYVKIQALLRTPLGDQEAILIGLQDKQEAYNRSMERAYDISYRFADSVTNVTEGVNWYAQRAQEAGERNAHFAVTMANVQAAAEAAKSPLTVVGQAYSDISTNVWGLTQALQDNIDFLLAGGGVLLELGTQAKEALNAGNFAGAQEALDAAALGAIDLDLELGKIDPEEAIQRMMDLGLGPEEAKAKVEELQSTIFALTAQSYAIRFNIEVSGDLPGSTGTTVTKPTNDEAWATGTGGWRSVPSGYPNDSFSVGLSSGEKFNVAAPGQSSGGGMNVNILGPIYVDDGADFMATIAAMAQRSSRNAAGVNAGAGMTGRQ